MKIAEFLPSRPNRMWRLSRQVGVRYAICKVAPELTGLGPPWEIDALRTIQRGFAEAGFVLQGLEGDPFDLGRVKLGLPGRDEDLDRYRRMLSHMGELGIPLLCYNFMAGIGWHRSQANAVTRGGALTSGFDLRDVPEGLTEAGVVSAGRMWENYAHFIREVMPAAEAAGVRMGLHPDDPPIPSLRGISRILSSPADIDRALALSVSPSHGVTFCQANFKLMGADLDATIRRLAGEQRLFFVHFRDVRGTAERFVETFHDDGPTDLPGLLRSYHEAGFEGPIRVDHVPTLDGEDNETPGYAMLGRLFAVGYLKGAAQALGIPTE